MSAVILIFQHLRERIMFDRNNLVMKPRSLQLNMTQFRLAIRQYTIDKEFELDIEVTDKTRYRCYCRNGDCHYSINVRV
jgi:hypothetical protein